MKRTDNLYIQLADEKDREMIYRLRHAVYAGELGQHAQNSSELLKDDLDTHNVYIVAKQKEAVVGFISITLPLAPHYSIDKYIKREALPFVVDEGLVEFRILTVTKPYRYSMLAFLLMYAAYRYAKTHHFTRAVAIGRLEVLDLYIKCGLIAHGIQMQSGAVKYELVSATMDRMDEYCNLHYKLATKALQTISWNLAFPPFQAKSCYHGGAFFDLIGNQFDTLSNCETVINADVLDAWFSPAPAVLSALTKYLPWVLKTSPPTHCEGLIQTIAEKRGLPPSCILPGAGSSELMFRVLPDLLHARSKVLVLDPTYGEYLHILKNVIGCRVDKFQLTLKDGYQINLSHWQNAIQKGYDMVILVNPNSPTGCYLDRKAMLDVLQYIPNRTKVWIDETYIDYVGCENSIETFAVTASNIIVCKSMSKVYALSGVRVAYLCSGISLINDLKGKTPPWIISLPGQISAVSALHCPDYYKTQYQLTHQYRSGFVQELEKLNMGTVFAGQINCLLIHLENTKLSAHALVQGCKKHKLLIRDATKMGHFNTDVIRIAVKDDKTNQKMIQIIKNVIQLEK